MEEIKYRDLTYKIIGVYYEVYNELGHGFLESVYQKSLGLALKSAGLDACWPIAIPVASEDTRWATLKRICWSRSVSCSN